VAGEGMPVSKAGSAKRRGDLIVRWNVVFPSRLTPAQKQELRKVLG
jgi:DnaJ family protein B protein 4